MNEASTTTRSVSLRWLATSWAILIACLAIASVFLPTLGPGGERKAAIGFILGAIYCQVSAANVWMTLGSGHLLLRLFAGLFWVFATPVALCINLALHRFGAPDNSLFLFLTIGVVGQSLLLQLPLVLLRRAFGWRIRASEPGIAATDDERLQFRLSHLMLFTTLIAIVLGIGRQLVGLVPMNWTRGGAGPDFAIFIFLAAAAALLSLPLILSVLVPGRRSWLAVLCVVVFIALFTVYELPLSQAIGAHSRGLEVAHLIWINVFSSLGVLLFGAAARFSNYRLTT